MNKEAIIKIKDSVSALDACHRYGIGVNRAGFARCLFHEEKSPSMKVYPSTGGFHCFGCGVGGSVIDLVMKALNQDMPTACDTLNRDFGLGLDLELDGRDRPRRKPTKGERLAQAREEYERRKAQREADARLNALEQAVNEAEQEAIKLLRQKAEFDPRRKNGEITAEYADAVRRLPQVLYEAEAAEHDLYEFLGIGKKRD